MIEVENVSKKFCRDLKKSLWYGVKDISSDLTGRKNQKEILRPDEFWAVRDVSFKVARGECLGLVGFNGAGKTTLLRMLNGLIKPDKGNITVRGRVAALIALGAGFDPILTGRENVYAAGALLGLSTREINDKYNAIVDFAELDKFMDTPVQNYSSGMQVRLGFAVAAQMEADVLILDEVLAVGDIGFTIKCLNHIRHISRDVGVIFVSHNMQFISLFCTRVIVLKNGKILLDSPSASEGIDQYYALVKHDVVIYGKGEVQVLDMSLSVNGDILSEAVPAIVHGAGPIVLISILVKEPLLGVNIIVNVLDQSMTPILSIPILNSSEEFLTLTPGKHDLSFPLGDIDLNRGKYSFTVVAQDVESSLTLMRIQGLSPFQVIAEGTYWGKLVQPKIASQN